MRFDLHVHTTISACSNLYLEDILCYAQTRNLDGVCLTDHHAMTVLRRLREGEQENGLVIIVGQEYETAQGDFLLFGPFEDLPPGLEAWRLLQLVRDSGGVAIGAHPFRSKRPLQEHFVSSGLCPIVEGMNGRNTVAENMKLQTWRRKHSFREVGGSDAHTLDELGRYPTRFLQRIDSREALINTLKSGEFQVETGSPLHQTAHVS